MAPSLQILSLEEISQLTKRQDDETKLCHVYGIFLQEDSTQNSHHWTLSDSTCLKGLKIKLAGSLAEYPRPKPGDILRIHRLSFDRLLRLPLVAHPRNVVLWPAFQYEPTPITAARLPTITPEDTQKRRVLETLYCSMITRISEIKPNQNSNHQFYTVAGRVEEKSSDPYYNSLLTFSDGTGQFLARVFPKKIDFEVNDHCQVVRDLKIGDYFVLRGGKLDSRGQKLDLSANFHFGRSIRIVDKASILGVVLKEQLKESSANGRPDDHAKENDPNSTHPKIIPIPPQQVRTAEPEPVPEASTSEAVSAAAPLRRSPRFLAANTDKNTGSTSPKTPQTSSPTVTTSQHVSTICSVNNDDDDDDDEFIDPVGTPTHEPQFSAPTSQGPQPQGQQNQISHDQGQSPIQSQSILSQSSQSTQSPQPPPPQYTKVSDIKSTEQGFYTYYNLVGQVRGNPNETRFYKNWVFQLYDGSKHNFKSFYVDEVQRPVQDCVTILVYSKQKDHDSSKHIDAVKQLKEGDLVLIKNCKASWRNGTLKLEMNANEKFGKSINVIDKESQFGIMLRNIVENPLVEELFQTDGSADSEDL